MTGDPHMSCGRSFAGVEPVLGVAEPEGADRAGDTTWGEDTIVAVSTATGPGAIGIVRMSGPDAIAIAESAFRPCLLYTSDAADE